MISSWVEQRGHQAMPVRLFDGDPLPQKDEVEMLILMGGPMSVNDEETHPWLSPEKELVREIIESGKPVFGVCLGAQLIASALGKKVYPAPELEVGWFPVQAGPSGAAVQFSLPDEVTVLHWHGETFDLPDRSIRLGSSKVCKNQAFLLGERVVGTQFHFEADREAVEGFLGDSYEGLSSDLPYVQRPVDIREGVIEHEKTIEKELFRLLDFLVR